MISENAVTPNPMLAVTPKKVVTSLSRSSFLVSLVALLSAPVLGTTGCIEKGDTNIGSGAGRDQEPEPNDDDTADDDTADDDSSGPEPSAEEPSAEPASEPEPNVATPEPNSEPEPQPQPEPSSPTANTGDDDTASGDDDAPVSEPEPVPEPSEPVPDVRDFELAPRTMSAGRLHTCAVSEGKVYCWGDNSAGQLGTGNKTAANRASTTVSGIDNAEQVTAGAQHSCALLADGSVECWGENGRGQLGEGSTTDFTRPVAAEDLPEAAIGLCAGAQHSCALGESGAVYCWGDNTTGQLGNGDTSLSKSNTPVAVEDIGNFVSIACGENTTCGATSGGKAYCWGLGFAMGPYGTMENSYVPAPINEGNGEAITGVKTVAVGYSHACALLNNGAVRCWGSSSYNELGGAGDGTGGPVQVDSVDTAIDIALGYTHSCAVLTDGSVRCWGNVAQAGVPSSEQGNPAPWEPDVEGARLISASGAQGYHTCVLLEDDNIECWGTGTNGQLGRGSNSTQTTPGPVSGF
jgi:alpha-tubulin suppressor-like RCC1 family protein